MKTTLSIPHYFQDNDERIISLIKELQTWPGPSISSHKSARQFFHKLSFLADIGVTFEDPGMPIVLKKVLSHRDENGIPQIPMTISKSYGGSGKEEWSWALCDAPTTLYSLKKMGFEDAKTIKAANFLANNLRKNGWGCIVGKNLGTWHGPGRKDDPCPYATLITTKLLLQYGKEFQKEIKIGAETILNLWKNSKTLHPYIFYMGNDFRKLKLPFIWYDILHVVDVLSQIKGVSSDSRFIEMWNLVINKPKDSNRYIPESVYQEWKNWDFGQKKFGSAWLSFCIEKIKVRLKSD